MCTQRTVEEVTGADGINLDTEGSKLESEGLCETDAAELCACICEVLIASLKTGLGVDLDNVCHILGRNLSRVFSTLFP